MLASRKPAERAQVMALGSQLHVLTQPTQDAATLRAAVEQHRARRLARQLRRTGARASAPWRESMSAPSSCTSSATCSSPTCRRTSPSWPCPPTSRSSCIRWRRARAELDGRERERARPGVGPEEGARAGGDRRLRHAGRDAHGLARGQRQDRCDASVACAGRRPRHRRIPVARRALRLQPLRGAHRFRRRLAGRRRQSVRRRALRSAAGAVRSRSERPALAAVFRRRAGRGRRIGIHAG